jgi:hypothetical protein
LSVIAGLGASAALLAEVVACALFAALAFSANGIFGIYTPITVIV